MLFPGILLATIGDTARVYPPKGAAINLWVDLSLGLIGEKEAKEKMNSLDAGFKKSLKSETEALTENLHGVRKVSGKQFASLVAKMNQISSFSKTTVIGKLKREGTWR